MTLFSLLALLFAPTIRDLDSRDFATRHAARLRLERAGWVAYPALVRGGETAEACRVCDVLAERLVGFATVTPAALLYADDNELDRMHPLVVRVISETVKPRVVTVRFCDSQHDVIDTSLVGWLSNPPYYSGTRAGDVRAVLEAIR